MVYVNDIHSSYNDVKDDSLRRDEYYAERVADETAISVRKILVSDFKMDLNDAIEFSDRLREEGLYHNLKAIREKHSITRKKKRK
jgi:hypothetical protein